MILTSGRRPVGGADLHVLTGGSGPLALVLHGFDTFRAASPFLCRLAASGRSILAPAHPGFGSSSRPPDFDGVEDLVNLYLDLIDGIDEPRLDLVGLSFGGWIAAEIAIRYGHRLRRLVLIDPVGIRVGERDKPDIFHLFNESPEAVAYRTFADVSHAPDFDTMTDAEIIAHARNREALCRYAWQPYLHNPRLRRWLHRISAPTLVLWGETDGIVAPAYGRAFAAAIADAVFEVVPDAGHRPDIERPHICADRVAAFLTGAPVHRRV